MNELIKEVTEPRLCECGCGEEALFNKKKKVYNRFIFGHQNRGKNNWLFGKHPSEESKRKNSEAHNGKKVSEETRKKLSELNKGEKNSNYGKMMSDEQKEKIRKTKTGVKHTDEHRKNNSEAHMGENNHFYGKHHSEETKIILREINTGKTLSKETREKVSKSLKGKYTGERNWNFGIIGDKNPFYGRKHTKETKDKIREAREGKYGGENHSMYGKHHTEEAKLKMSKAKIGKKASEDARKKMSEAHSGEKHYNWQGGKSFEPYCPKFNEAFKEKIREKFNRECFLCGKNEYQNYDRKMSVHHVQYNKNCGCDDTLKCDFVPLCMSCHAKTSNSKREYWESEIVKKLNVS